MLCKSRDYQELIKCGVYFHPQDLMSSWFSTLYCGLDWLNGDYFGRMIKLEMPIKWNTYDKDAVILQVSSDT